MRVFVELDVEDAVLALLLDRRRAAPTAVSLPASSPPPRALDQEQRWLRVKEAARYASVSTSTIYDVCARGELQNARVGGNRSVRLLRDWIDAWLSSTGIGRR